MTGAELVGKKITAIYMDEDHLRFDTDQGSVAYEVYGDCCSHSYFYDFLGVRNLLNNGPVVSVSEIDPAMPDDEDARKGDCVRAYGYEIVTEDPIFGEVTSVLSFRNDSNGYYGGWMDPATPLPADQLSPVIDDVLDTSYLQAAS